MTNNEIFVLLDKVEFELDTDKQHKSIRISRHDAFEVIDNLKYKVILVVDKTKLDDFVYELADFCCIADIISI